MRGGLISLAALVLLGAGEPPRGYLAAPVDVAPALAPAPTSGDPRDRLDRTVYQDMQRLIGSPRWTLATADVKYGPAPMMAAFACAAGIVLTPDQAPRLTALLARVSIDTSAASGAAKRYFKRDRPYVADDGQTCQPKIELVGSADYPSGHATRGWTVGLILAELMPHRATPILARARAYADSRIVCRVHSMSAAQAGAPTAAATIAALHGSAAFRADIDAARAELDALRADPATPRPDAATCAAEAKLIAEPL